MGSASEDRLASFLARQPSWVRKSLQGDYALTPNERAEMLESDWPEVFGQAQDEYRELLRPCPAKLREYRKLQKRLASESALQSIPSVPLGAPRKDALAEEAMTLRLEGLSQNSIARKLNERHPNLADRAGNPRPITGEVVRKLLATRRQRIPPEKT